MRLDTMLIAVDFSETAARAAQWAAREFAPDANIVLLHVIDPPDRPRFARHPLPPEKILEDAAREHAETQLRALSERLGRRDVRSEIRVGRPYEQVSTVATEVNADLVVIGPHGDRPRPWNFLGTTADRIARTSPVPILIVTDPRPHAPKRILVTVDDATVTPRVVEWTRMLAEQFDASVTVLNVWSNAAYSYIASMAYAETKTEAEAKLEIEKELADAAARWLDEVAPSGVSRDRFAAKVSYGYAGEVALEHARENDDDLIVIGRTSAGLLKPALIGSTTDTVLHGARCPVLVVTRDAGESSSSPR